MLDGVKHHVGHVDLAVLLVNEIRVFDVLGEFAALHGIHDSSWPPALPPERHAHSVGHGYLIRTGSVVAGQRSTPPPLLSVLVILFSFVEDGMLWKTELQSVPKRKTRERSLARHAHSMDKLCLVGGEQQGAAGSHDGWRAPIARRLTSHREAAKPVAKHPTMRLLHITTPGCDDDIRILPDTPSKRVISSVVVWWFGSDRIDVRNAEGPPEAGRSIVCLVDGRKETLVISDALLHVLKLGAFQGLFSWLVSRKVGQFVEILSGVAGEAHVQLELPEMVEFRVVQGEKLHGLEDLPHSSVTWVNNSVHC